MQRVGNIKIWHWILGAALAMGSAARADVRLPSVIASDMVVQRATPVAVWGWANPGENVSVQLGEGEAVSAAAGDNGKWNVSLEPVDVGDPMDMVITGKNTITLHNIVAGEVWVCSGQSNMDLRVENANNAEAEIAAADYPMIRMFTVERRPADTPQDDCRGAWNVCDPEHVKQFSAVGYFYARELHRELGVPVGMLFTAWGGTFAEAWTRLEVLQADEMFAPIVERRGEFNPDNPNRASVLYNGMLSPLLPYRIKGAIWYQGESNLQRAWQYASLFPAMIRNWRADWGEGDFPFYFVQLAPYRYSDQDPRNCAELWEAQTRTLSLPNTGMAVTMDIGNVKDIHPRNKQDVGKRLALWALAKDYGRDIVHSGPLYEKMAIEGKKIRLYFTHVGSGLVTRNGQAPSFFQVAGEDRNFVDAQAQIDGDSLLVWSDLVPSPVAARFAWRDDAQPNLMNKEGLPAGPFRTDAWEMATEGVK